MTFNSSIYRQHILLNIFENQVIPLSSTIHTHACGLSHDSHHRAVYSSDRRRACIVRASNVHLRFTYVVCLDILGGLSMCVCVLNWSAC